MQKKYSEEEDNINTLHDIKVTSKRTSQFVIVAIWCASVIMLTRIFLNNYLSAVMVGSLDASLFVLLYVNKKVSAVAAKVGIILLINIFLVLIAFAEGLNTGNFLFFLPLLFAIPFLVENNKNFVIELVIYITLTLLCFGYCVLFIGKTSSWQDIPEATMKPIFIINAFSSFMVCATYAYLSIYLERKYVSALLEQKNKTEEAMLARSRFLSSMGHELRTPLNGIIGATNLLRKGSSTPNQKEYLDILKYCSDHMLGLVNDILDYNKIEADQIDLHPTECNMKNLLHQSSLPFYNRFEEKKLVLKVIVDEALDEVVLVDDLRLVQVLNNLLSNALKFTESGSVKMIAQLKQKSGDLATISFAVKDTGIGVSKQFQEKIFESFWQVYDQTTRKYGGTGLGLTICKRLLTLMDSKLEVESEVGKGSMFSFSIKVPIIPAQKDKLQKTEVVTWDLTGIRILLAEDNLINLMIAKKILEDKNAHLTTAENGKHALDELACRSDYDLILLDLEMPVMDGYTAVREMRSNYPHIPVIAFTAALMDKEMWNKLMQLGFIDCILKPFQPEDLFAKVRKYATHTVAIT